MGIPFPWIVLVSKRTVSQSASHPSPIVPQECPALFGGRPSGSPLLERLRSASTGLEKEGRVALQLRIAETGFHVGQP